MMSSASVYAEALCANSISKETLIYEGVEAALMSMISVEKSLLDERDGYAAGRSVPGLAKVRSSEQIIALGRAAHTVLADVQKRTLIAGDLELESRDEDEFADVIDRFIWSCVNTLKVVAVGQGAWRSVQMLPMAERSFFDVPPLRLASPALPLDAALRQVLVVNHEADGRHAGEVAAALRRTGFSVEMASIRSSRGDDSRLDEACWSFDAAVHVHVGTHSIASAEPRIVDTWHSRRLACQVLPRRTCSGSGANDQLMVEDEVNGLLCHTPDKLLDTLLDLRQDRVMQRKLIEGGARTVAPLMQNWLRIAEELLA